MATHAARGKKGAGAPAPEPEKGMESRAPAPEPEKGGKAQETGVCIICGEEKAGTPAEPELPVRAARYLRAAFKQPARHTIACREHLDEARGKRAKYGKRARDYGIYAILFFIFVVAGSLFFGRIDAGMFMPAILGALIVSLFPHFYYFPPFGK